MRNPVFHPTKLICVVTIGALAACRPPESKAPSSPPAMPRRIVSISPDATEIIAAIGAADRLVGVSDFCNYPPRVRTLPRVGGLFDVNLEMLLRLQPDLIVLRGRHQAVERLCADNGIRLFRDGTESLEDVFKTIDELGEALGAREAAATVVSAMRKRLDRISAAVANRPRPRVLMTLARKPDSIAQVLTAGKGTFVDSLITVAGGQNIFGDLAVQYPHVSAEAILVARPDVIIEAMPETKPNDAVIAQARALWRSVGPMPAIEQNRVFILFDENSMIPSPRIVEVASRMARLLHPEAEIE